MKYPHGHPRALKVLLDGNQASPLGRRAVQSPDHRLRSDVFDLLVQRLACHDCLSLRPMAEPQSYRLTQLAENCSPNFNGRARKNRLNQGTMQPDLFNPCAADVHGFS